MNKRIDKRNMAVLAMMAAIEILLTLTPLGFLMIGPIRATMLHIPVIITALFLGWKAGLFMGGLFGLISLLMNTFAPTPVSFVFTPFLQIGPYHGTLLSLWIVLGPRMIFPLAACAVQKALKGFPKISIPIAAAVSSFLHTALVMGSIWLIFGDQYAAARGITAKAFLKIVLTTIFVNGTGELILAALIVTPCVKALQKIAKK